MNVQTTSTGILGNIYYLTPLQKIVLDGSLSLYATTAAQRALFTVCNVSQLTTPVLLADQSQGFNAGITLLGLCMNVVLDIDYSLITVTFEGATVELGGVLLQWDRVQEPYANNFVQYRPVSNLTSTLSYNDTITPWTTLPMIPRDIPSMLVPSSYLDGGAYYEFRLAFQSGIHTSHSNTQALISTTYNAASFLIGNVETISFDTMISVSWNAPEYSDELIGYAVSVFFKASGNAGVADPQWGASGSTLLSSFQLPLTQLSFSYGCTDLTASDSLAPFTTYLVDIAVIRSTKTDVPKSIYVSTQHTIASLHNTSSIYLYAVTITMNFTVAMPQYAAGTPINATILHPLNLHTTRIEDLNVNLTQSTVESVSNTSMKVTLSLSEYKLITSATIYNPSFLFTPFVIEYGAAQLIEPCSVHCLCVVLFRLLCREFAVV